jgi:hypothetical protein
MNAFKKAKRSLYLLFEKLIQKSDDWHSKLNFFPDTGWRKIIRKTVCFLGDLGWLLRDIFPLPAYQARGKDWRIVFVGREVVRSYVESCYFENESIQWEKIDQVHPWERAKSIRKWCADGVDLAIFEVSRILPLVKGVEYGFQSPWLVRQVLTLPKSPEMLLAGGSRKTDRGRIRMAERNGFSFRFSNSLYDFDHFYHDLYFPYVNKRHGKNTLADSYENMLNKFRRGGLVQVFNREEIVGASLVIRKSEMVYMTEIGKSEVEIKEKGFISLLIFWFTILWAYDQGVNKVDIGASQARCSNGVFHHKNLWKPKVFRFDSYHSIFQAYASKVSPNLLEALNGMGFISEERRDFFRVILQPGDSDFSRGQEEEAVQEAKKAGLSGILLIRPFSKKILKAI